MSKRIVYARLSMNVEKLPKQYFVKTKTGTFLNVDLRINLDDPKIFDNGGRNFGSFSKPQSEEERTNKTPKEWFNGFYLDVTNLATVDGDKFEIDKSWPFSGQDKSKVEEVVVEDSKADLPF